MSDVSTALNPGDLSDGFDLHGRARCRPGGGSLGLVFSVFLSIDHYGLASDVLIFRCLGH